MTKSQFFKYTVIFLLVIFLATQLLVLTKANAKSSEDNLFLRSSAISNTSKANYKVKITAKESLEIEVCKKITLAYLDKFSPIIPTLENVIIHNDNSLRRGLSNSTVIYMRCLSDHDEFLNVLIHEIGHVVDLGYLTPSNTNSNNISEFKDFDDPIYITDPSYNYYLLSWKNNTQLNKRSVPTDFVSTYGSSDPFEDFAESFMMYIRYNELFRNIAKDNYILQKKYDFFENFFQANEIKHLVEDSIVLTSIDNPEFVVKFLRQNSLYDATRIHQNLREYL